MIARISPARLSRLTRLRATSAAQRTATPPTHGSGRRSADVCTAPSARPCRPGGSPPRRAAPHVAEVDVEERGGGRTIAPDADRLLHVRRELQLVLEVLRREQRAVGQLSDVLRAFFFQAEDGIRDPLVTGVQTCALPI